MLLWTRSHEALRVWCSTCRVSKKIQMEPFPADPSGKSWDKASGKKGSGKLFHHNVISGADFATQPRCVDCVVFGRVAGGACIRYMLYERSDPAAGSVNVASRWRTLSQRSRPRGSVSTQHTTSPSPPQSTHLSSACCDVCTCNRP